MNDILANPFTNKGTAFTEEERQQYGLVGRLPAKVETIAEQSTRVLAALHELPTNYLKHLSLMDLYEENRTLFFYTVIHNITELLPILYTPTVADGIMNFSRDFKTPRGAAYLNVNEPERIKEALLAASEGLDEIKMMVITDGEGILGIGDWGVQGAWITTGKLAVYTAASGINPKSILPVSIDAGTDRQELIDSPYYLGLKQPRLRGDDYLAYIDQFVEVAKEVFPNVLFHWEDFGRDHATQILDRYRYEICTFNDDIQGTGVMMNAAIAAACQVMGESLENQRVLIFGAGSAGIGIADQITNELQLKGMSFDEAKQNIYCFDRLGLVRQNEEGNMTSGKVRYARSLEEFPEPLMDLSEAIDIIQPSILVGCSGQPGMFTQEVIEKMCQYNERPAILPISNPTLLNEAQAYEVIEWSKGKALCVTGSPSDPVEYEGTTFTIGQANNALLYPGLGLGIVIAQAKHVTDKMLNAAAHGIASLQDLSYLGAPILPHVSKLRQASKLVAKAVIEAAIEEGMAQVEIQDIDAVIDEAIWQAEY